MPDTNTKTVLKRVSGGLEEIQMYYQTKAPKVPHARVKALTVGKAITGTYEGSFLNKFDKSIHRVKTAKGLVGVVGTSGLNRDMVKIDQGAEVSITYQGTQKIKTGPYAGKDTHTFDVLASSFDPNRKGGLVEAKYAKAQSALEVDDNDPF